MLRKRLVIAAAVLTLGTMFLAVTESDAAQAHPMGAQASVPNPTVTGPVVGGRGEPAFDPPFDVAEYGYTADEYFLAGKATAYGVKASPAPYVTRIIVYRPLDRARFSGNTILEWANVSLQLESPAEFEWTYRQLFASGDVYVQVSVQQASVCGTLLSGASKADGSDPTCVPTSLKGVDPVRYRPLTIPGDDYSYDIFSQVAQAIRHPYGSSPLNGLVERHLYAIGVSQSGIALDNYIRLGADGAAKVFDGFLIDADGQSTEPTAYRVPTITIWSEETARPTRMLDQDNHVTWSVAGAAHTDHWVAADALQGWAGHTLQNLPERTKAEQDAFVAANSDYGQEGPSSSTTCAGGSEFPRRYVVDAAIANLERWVASGRTAPTTPPLRFTDTARRIAQLPPLHIPGLTMIDEVNWLAVLGMPFALVHDHAGNAVGGLRLPVMAVPVAHYDGTACVLFGTTTPFSRTVLHSLYPTHDNYVARMIAATTKSVAARFLTRSDAIELLTRACDSAIPEWGKTPAKQQPIACHDLNKAIG